MVSFMPRALETIMTSNMKNDFPTDQEDQNSSFFPEDLRILTPTKSYCKIKISYSSYNFEKCNKMLCKENQYLY